MLYNMRCAGKGKNKAFRSNLPLAPRHSFLRIIRMSRFISFLVGLALLPLCVAVTLSLLDILRSLSASSDTIFSPATIWLLAGYLIWLGVWFVLPPPVRTYVMAHELTHALWGLMFGARVRNLRVSDKGGSVSLSKTNLLITLAPYFFPFYTMVVIVLHWVVGLFVHPIPLPFLWLFLVGFTWGFHLCFTVQSLMTHQPDIHEYGRLFSYTIIYLFNLAGICLWIVCTTSASLLTLAGILSARALLVYGGLIDWAGRFIQWGAGWIRKR